MHHYLKQDLTTAMHNCAPGQCSLKHPKVGLFLIDYVYCIPDEAVMYLTVLNCCKSLKDHMCSVVR